MIKILIQTVLGAFDGHALHGIEEFVNAERLAGRIHNMMDKMLKHENIADLVPLNDVFQQDGINVTLQDFNAKGAIQCLYFRETAAFQIIRYSLAQQGDCERPECLGPAGKEPVKFQIFRETERKDFYR